MMKFGRLGLILLFFCHFLVFVVWTTSTEQGKIVSGFQGNLSLLCLRLKSSLVVG